jgi:uncharacterized repeat protein (TIGR03803 family)
MKKMSSLIDPKGFICLFVAILILAGFAQAETVLHSFSGDPDGYWPHAGLIHWKGNFYGTTYIGGPFNSGSVFELSPPAAAGGVWTETVLYGFPNYDGGQNPRAGVIIDDAGNIYGTTQNGGTSGDGVVFELSPPTAGGNWTETVLHNFALNHKDGESPWGGLTFGRYGALYGTTYYEGTNGGGTVYVIYQTAGGSEGIIHNFDATTGDGANPTSSLIADKAW